MLPRGSRGYNRNLIGEVDIRDLGDGGLGLRVGDGGEGKRAAG
jgi:hypothetical protein